MLFDNLEKLKHFRQVAESGSFLAAGRSAGVTQQSVYYSVKKLEESLDCQLFHRSRKGVSLTSQGQKLLEFTNWIEDKTLALERSLCPSRKSVRLGLQTPLIPHIGGPLLGKLSKADSELDVSLRTDLSAKNLIKLLQTKMCDFIIAAELPMFTGLEARKIYRDSYGLFVRNGHALTQQKTLPQIDLTNHPSNTFIFLEQAIAGAHVDLSDVLIRTGHPGCSAMDLDSFEALKGVCIHSDFIALLPKSVVDFPTKENQLTEIGILGGEELGGFNIYLVYPKGPELDKIADTMLIHLQKISGSFAPDSIS